MGKHSGGDLDPTTGQDRGIIYAMNSTKALVYMELNVSEEEDSFIEYHFNDNEETQTELQRFLNKAQSLGYVMDAWLEIEVLPDGYRRAWLVKGHDDDWRALMPDMTLTAYGPASGCMEAVRA